MSTLREKFRRKTIAVFFTPKSLLFCIGAAETQSVPVEQLGGPFEKIKEYRKAAYKWIRNSGLLLPSIVRPKLLAVLPPEATTPSAARKCGIFSHLPSYSFCIVKLLYVVDLPSFLYSGIWGMDEARSSRRRIISYETNEKIFLYLCFCNGLITSKTCEKTEGRQGFEDFMKETENLVFPKTIERRFKSDATALRDLREAWNAPLDIAIKVVTSAGPSSLQARNWKVESIQDDSIEVKTALSKILNVLTTTGFM
jgi:hypothetical protein